MASDDVKVITFWASPYGLRAEFALAAKGVPFQQLLEVDHWFNKSKLLLESNPIHKQIPVLLHNGKPIPESFIIIEYIDETWPSPPGQGLLPSDPYDRAMARFWSDYVDKKSQEEGAVTFNSYPAYMGGPSEKLGNTLKKVRQSKDEVQKVAVEEVMTFIATLEGVLEKAPNGGPFFGGDHVGMVDVVLGPLFLWFPAYEIIGNFKFQLEERFPRLHAWSEALKTSPCASCFPDPETL